MNKKCYFNGKFVDFDEVKISPYDLGFLRGYGVFDAMKTVNEKWFLFDEHWNKFVSSAQELNLNIPVSKEEFRDILEKLKEAMNCENCAARTILTGGVSEDTFNVGENPTFLILLKDLEKMSPPKEIYEGVKVVTIEHKRSVFRAKNSNYISAIQNQTKKREAGAIEIVYVYNNKALEASTSNFFIIQKGKLITPLEDVFWGTTRNLVIELAEKNGIEVEEREVSVDEMFNADEMFLTATYKNIIPVIKVNDREIGNGKIGEVTKKLMGILEDFMKNY
ncbi:MAG: aminotransferase class IV [Candidatus Moranbacteria bacterium]|nr:aminotransferase class IV [Candidatus Moranbacteria bacterium]